MLKRTHVRSIRNCNKARLVCTRFYRVLRLECHSQGHVVSGRCPSPVVPEGTLTQTFRRYMFPSVLHSEPKQNHSPTRCSTFCASLITQYNRGGQSRTASGDALRKANWERTIHQYFFIPDMMASYFCLPTPIDKIAKGHHRVHVNYTNIILLQPCCGHPRITRQTNSRSQAVNKSKPVHDPSLPSSQILA